MATGLTIFCSLGIVSCNRNEEEINSRNASKSTTDVKKSSEASKIEQSTDATQLDKAVELDTKCRGNAPSDSTEKICQERDTLWSSLKENGWCYGSEDEASYQRKWERCSDNAPSGENVGNNPQPKETSVSQKDIDPTQMELMRKSYPQCYTLAQRGMKIFAFTTWDLPTSMTEGRLSFTEVAIKAKNKTICTDGVVESRTEIGDATVVGVETERVLCYQLTDSARMAAVKLDRKGYNIIGKFVSTQGRSIRLDNCQFLTQ